MSRMKPGQSMPVSSPLGRWGKPLGAHDAYPQGAKVSHRGKHWVSEIDANTYEPGVYGWEQNG